MSTAAAFKPTTTCSILRTDEGEVDEYGDPVDNETVSASGIPISISVQEATQFLPVEHRKTVYTVTIARLREDVDVKSTDRIKDELTGDIYMIESILFSKSALWSSTIKLELRKLG